MLDVSHQQMEEYRDQPSHAEKIAYQQKLLQEDVVHIRAEISQVSTVRPTWLIKLKICNALLLQQCYGVCLSAECLFSSELETRYELTSVFSCSFSGGFESWYKMIQYEWVGDGPAQTEKIISVLHCLIFKICTVWIGSNDLPNCSYQSTWFGILALR